MPTSMRNGTNNSDHHHHPSKPPRIMTAHRVETLTQTRRAEERRIVDLLNYKNESQRLSSMAAKNQATQLNIHNDSKFIASSRANGHDDDDGQRQHRQNGHDTSRKMRDGLRAVELEQQTQEEATQQRQQTTIELEIRRICESSEELKELERNLKVAYVNKERAAQHQESLLIQMEENAREQVIEERMELDRQSLTRDERERRKTMRDNLVAQKIMLQDQMQKDDEARIEEATKEALKDKAMVDEILSKIDSESKKEVAGKGRKVEETRSLIQQYQKEREDRQRDLMIREEEHEKKIAAYNDMTQKRREREREQKKLAEDETKRTWTRVAKETQNLNQSKEEYNLLRDMLWEQELEEKQKKEEEEAILCKMELKENTLRQNLEQIETKKEMIKNMEDEESHLVRQMLDKFRRDEEDEENRQRAIFDAKERFMAEAQSQRDQRLHMFKQEKQSEYQERHAGVEQEEYRQRVIAEARKRLLLGHAAQVQGFLPKGAIINKDEAKLFQQAT